MYVSVRGCWTFEQTPQADPHFTQPRATHHLECTGQRGLRYHFQGYGLCGEQRQE